MKEKKIYKRLSIFFWLNIVLLGGFFLFILQQKGENFGNIPSNVALERWAIIITIAAIPFALKVFHSLLKKLKAGEAAHFHNKYVWLYTARILILDMVALLNIIAFEIYESNNFIYLTIVIIFAMMFCYPNRNELTYSTDIPDNTSDVPVDEMGESTTQEQQNEDAKDNINP
ncbi:hypothetical protein [Dysgonomonas sp. 25]|uniref:hypothetical protein n=1 Tax=Dysgonomonas sp. 25 TaxID=2302933 RepID=UPI0013D17FE2|nr:hypothetical protein [Dysgonomonas sp. 25]NDV67517.1 hypothetical protein [Dysgonomonas sp. 25]